MREPDWGTPEAGLTVKVLTAVRAGPEESRRRVETCSHVSSPRGEGGMDRPS